MSCLDCSFCTVSSEPSPSLLPPSFSPSSHEDVFSPPGPVSPSRPVAKLVKVSNTQACRAENVFRPIKIIKNL